MEHEGMVHALRRIKALLRRDGTLIDIHPVRRPPVVEVLLAGTVVFAEPSPGFDYDDDLRQADDALAWAVENGVFRLDGSREFEVVTYAASIGELRDFFAVTGAYEEPPRDTRKQARIVEQDRRVEEVMKASAATKDIAHREWARMTRLIPASS